MEQLLATKLFIPPSLPAIIPRPHLIERLDGGLHRKMTLISAPAGFGKTTLVTEWLHSLLLRPNIDKNQIAWLSLDENDNDLVRFLTYIIAALDQVGGEDFDPDEWALGMLQSPQSPPPDIILTSIVNEIAKIEEKIVFVLDDYHLIDAQSIHDTVSFFVEHLPPQLHLVIATREDPLLPLSRLRARGQMTELRAADLRFIPTEAAKFLNQAMGLGLSPGDITALETRTEGWISGLQMAALSLQGRQDKTSFVQAFTGSHRFVVDYLVEEVLQQQPENTRSFLLWTSILERLNGDLCDHVTQGENGNKMLEALLRGNLFVIPLDDTRKWYRYHHLFAEGLQDTLIETQSSLVAELHTRASEWYEQNNLPSSAIRHAIYAGDYERAADLAELVWPAWSGSYQSIEWLGWVKDLPEELVITRPVLCGCYAWACLNAGQLEAAETRLIDAERWLKPGKRDNKDTAATKMVVVDQEQFRNLPITLATARAYHAQAIGNLSGTVKYTQQVLDLIPEGDHPDRATATALQGLAYWASGDLESAYVTMSTGLAGMKPLDLIIGTFVLADLQNSLGRLQEAIKTCENALRLAADYGDPLGTEDVYSGISVLHLEQGDLGAAAQDIAAGKKLGDQVELPDWRYRWCIAQARMDETLRDLDSALDFLDEAARVYVRTPLPDIRPIAAMKVRVWIKQGKFREAQDWVRERNLSSKDDLTFMQEFEHITLTRVLIELYITERVDGLLDEGMQLLGRLLTTAEDGKRIRSLIEILVLQALAQEFDGQHASALGSLERALTLAEPQGYVQIFIDEGPRMAHLLSEARSHGIAVDYVRQLQGAYAASEHSQTGKPQIPVPDAQYVEALSTREIEVLDLIAQGMTNQEIADKLYLSLHTVKVHARNIFSKLGVKNRTQAVARGKSLGILQP